MKIYSDVLTADDLHRTAREVPGMYIDDIVTIPAKLRQRGWEVDTASTAGKRWKNSGKYGAGQVKAASWDDHGHWFAKLYKLDPNARIIRYKDATDFHKSTSNKYR